jgi:hypothetical protein
MASNDAVSNIWQALGGGGAARSGRRRGMAMQVDPTKPGLKPPVTKRVETEVLCTAFNLWFQYQLTTLRRGGGRGVACGRGGRGMLGGRRGGRDCRILPAS